MAVMLEAPYSYFTDTNGIPLNGGKVYTYAAGTTTPKATYTDYTEIAPAANPIILDSAGRASIWITGSYKFVVTDSNNVTLYTTDNVTAFSTSSTSNAGVLQPSGNLTLTTSDYGKTIVPNAGGITITLPALDSNNQGRTFIFSNINAASFSVVAAGTNKIYYGTSYINQSSIPVRTAETFTLQNFDINTWYAITDRAADVVQPIKAAFNNLKLTVVGNVDTNISADEVTLTSTKFSIKAKAVNINLSTGLSGAGGLDTGTKANSTWYAAYLIYNPTTATLQSLCSLSATAPTLPTGYTDFARLGWVRTDSSGNLLRTIQYGRRASYVIGTNPTALPLLLSGASGSTSTPTWTAIAIANFVPTTASAILVNITGSSGNVAAIAPNNTYGTYASITNPSYGMNATGTAQVPLVLESTNIYYAADASSNSARCAGWEDNL